MLRGDGSRAMSSDQATVAGWLASAGLEKYVENFADVSVEQFRGLLMQVRGGSPWGGR